MSGEREPLRLRDDPSQAPDLRALLQAAHGELADPAMLDRVLAGVLAGGGGGGPGGGGAAAGKIAAAIGTTVIGVGAIAWMMSGAHVSAPVTPVPASIVVVDAARADDAFVPVDAGASDVGLDAFVVVARRDRAPAPPSSLVETESDVALLFRATREHDPARSLDLALEHRARFAESPSSEDREALVVIDLARLHREVQARAAADTFRARWPRSAHLAHVEAELARMQAP